MKGRWAHAPLPGVCVRCDRVYLADTAVAEDIGGYRGACCAVTTPRPVGMAVTVRRAIADTERLIAAAAAVA